MLFFILNCFISDFWTVESLDIYQLILGTAVASPSGDVYVLDKSEKRIVHCRDGKIVGFLGGKGSGPGEFNRATYISYVDGQVVLQADNQFHFYDNNGSVSSVRHPRGIRFFRVKKGYVGINFAGQDDYQITHWSNDFKNKKVLLSWPRTMPYDEAMDIFYHPHLVVDPRKNLAFAIIDPESFAIHVFDLNTKKLLRIIEREVKAIPVSDAYIEASEARRSQISQSRGRPYRPKKYPKYFSRIGGAVMNGFGHLLLLTPTPSEGHSHLIAMSPEGEESERLPWSGRVFAVENGMAFISLYNAENGAGVACVPLEEAAAFVEKNPLEFE